MAGLVKTEAVVLRSIRYGEADRILHLYTSDRGRVGAIAKGVRRARIELHEGRGELLTVTGAHTVDGHARLRGDARALDAAARACDAVGLLLVTREPHLEVFNCSAGRSRCSTRGSAKTRPSAPEPALGQSSGRSRRRLGITCTWGSDAPAGPAQLSDN
jgi:recombinational DNA repair protein (RecF pathway)